MRNTSDTYDKNEPPHLTIASGNVKIQAMRGSYSWQRIAENGLAEYVIVDALLPLEAKEFMPCLHLSPGGQENDTISVHLVFEESPTKITAECYPVEAFNDVNARPQDVTIDSMIDCIEIDYADGRNSCEYYLNLKNSDSIYVLHAEWQNKGTAEYAFYTNFSCQ